MSDQAETRREFLKQAALAAGSAVAAGASGAPAAATRPATAQTQPAILNFNPKMGYRRLGRTGIMISEIGLGGHGAGGLEDRVAVLRRASELGINYLDTNIVDECALYGKALAGQRDHWYIGFASWPEKLTSDYEKELSPQSLAREIDGRLKHYGTDRLDLWRPVGATWGPGQTVRETMLEVSPRVLDMVAAAFEKARQQGKLRWLGISVHNPKVFRRVLNEYPQFSVILFPYLFMTQAQGGDSLLALAKEKDIGVIGIKPFAAGTTFGIKPNELKGKLDRRAHVLLKAILQEPRISAVIPGVNNVEQLEENVLASYERQAGLSAAEQGVVRQCAADFEATLTPEYRWLAHWKTV